MIKERISRAIQRGISATDVCSYGAITCQRLWSTWYGTLSLRVRGKLFGVRIGKGVTACGSVLLSRWPGSTIEIGDGSSLIASSRRCTASTLYAPVRLRTFYPTSRIVLGEGVQLNGTSITARSRTISIGKHTMIGPNCVITDSDFHAHWPAETRHEEPGLEQDADVRIGDHVWIGMGSLLLKGITIGDGAIIGAGSVVTRDIPAGCVAAGNPAVVKRPHIEL